jgi:hypothetical protein
MKLTIFPALLCAVGMVLFAMPAAAQTTRTWVSGVGADANPCSRTAPCATWAGAYAKTLAGGEIDALDPGGFGTLTINKSITLDGGGGQVASVLVSGANGINVAAGATDIVIIRNVRFQGALGNGSNPGSAGINGISFTSGGKLILDHVDINGFNNNCIVMANTSAAMLSVKDSTMENCAAGAILVMPSSTTASAYITNTVMAYSRFGLRVQDNGRATVSQSDASNNVNNGLIATSSSSPSEIDITYSVVANNGANGIITSGANALIRFANTAIFDNGQGINTSFGGTVTSFTPPTSVNAGNATAGAPNGAAIPQQ